MPPVNLVGQRGSIDVDLAASGSASVGAARLSSIAPIQTGAVIGAATIAATLLISAVGSAVGAAPASASITASASVSGAASRIASAAATITAGANITAVSDSPIQERDAAISATATITGAGAAIIGQAASITAGATVTGAGQDASAAEVEASASIAVTSVVAGEAVRITTGAAAISVASVLSGAGVKIIGQTASITTGATVAGAGLDAGATVSEASASIAAVSAVSGSALRVSTAWAAISTAAAVAGDAVRIAAAQAAITIASAVSGVGSAVTPRTIVVPLGGQSNQVGTASDDGGTSWPSGVYQYDPGSPVGAAGDINVHTAGGLTHVLGQSPGEPSIALQFAIRHMADYPNDKIIFIPYARGNTGMSTGDWIVGGSLYNDFITVVNTAIAEINAGDHDAEVGTGYDEMIILWHDGEADTGSASDAQDHVDNLVPTLTGVRTDITGADDTTVIIVGGLCDDHVLTNAPHSNTVMAAIQDVPNSLRYTAYVSGEGLGTDGGNHFNASGLRALGSGYYDAVATAKANVPAAPVQVTGVIVSPEDEQLDLTWPETPFATSYVVRRSTTSGSGYSSVGTPSTNSFSDTGLTNGVPYYYTVEAVNAQGTGLASDEASGTPAVQTVDPFETLADDIFTGGRTGILIAPGNYDYQETGSQTTLADAQGHPVGSIVSYDPSSNIITAPLSGKRPTLDISDGVKSYAFDGVDDLLTFLSIDPATTYTIAMAVKIDPGQTPGMFLGGGNANYYGRFSDGSSSVTIDREVTGSETITVDGASVTQTQDGFHTALATGSWVYVLIEGFQATWPRIDHNGYNSTFSFANNLGPVLIVDDTLTAGEKTDVETDIMGAVGG